MKHTHEEMLKALHIIKDTCKEVMDDSERCLDCPFSNKQGFCNIMSETPQWWNIKNKDNWRAFK